MQGRPRKVVGIATGKIAKEKRLNRAVQEKKIKLSRNQLEAGAPEWLGDVGAVEYVRVVEAAKAINLFDNLDLSILAIYANAYEMYVTATQNLQSDGLTTVGAKGAEIPSPYVAIADKAASQILRCSTKLGLAITDRLKLIVPTQSEERAENKYLKYLKA